MRPTDVAEGVGTTATVLSISVTIVCALGIAFVIYIARSTRSAGVAVPDPVALAEREKTWFGVVVVLLVSLLVTTIFFTPYGRTASADAHVEKIEGIQFAWLIRVPRQAGRQVEFELTSADVNHSFALYTMATLLTASGLLLWHSFDPALAGSQTS